MNLLQVPASSSAGPVTVKLQTGKDLAARLFDLESYVLRSPQVSPSRWPGWLLVLRDSMGHRPYALEAVRNDRTVGVLFLAYVHSLLFGRFLVGLPYLNSGGVVADDSLAETALIDRAVDLADELNVRFLELRHERSLPHRKLSFVRSDKVHMRLELPTTGAALWEQISNKVRNQVRKAQKNDFSVHWGGTNLLGEFHDVFSQNMRDLGTPTFGRKLFVKILQQFPNLAELCVVRDKGRPIAGALLLHGIGVSEVPSASSLKAYNSTCANMLLYWNLLERCAERKQGVFDFGRSSKDSATFRFKKQWGASASSAEWQYYLRSGSGNEMRADNPKYRRLIAIWRHLPVSVTRCFGPLIVRGIP